jgi:hypothetical protein
MASALASVARGVHMQVFHDLSINDRDALPFGLRLLEGRDLAAGEVDLGLGRGEGGIGDGDLRGVDQRFAVEAEIAPLGAFGGRPSSSLKAL